MIRRLALASRRAAACRASSSHAAPMLLRDFIDHALYSAAAGYFGAGAPVVGGLSEPLAFASMEGETEYRDALAKAYSPSSGRAWLTPVEVFSPHYGRAIGRATIERHEALYPREPLQMLEVGGGNGTCAVDLLSLLREQRPALYANCRYVLLEISPRLAEAQRANLHAAGHAAVCEVHQQCARRWAVEAAAGAAGAAGALGGGPWWVQMFEVLDNLPHDKVRLSETADGRVVYEEAVVFPPAGQGHEWTESCASRAHPNTTNSCKYARPAECVSCVPLPPLVRMASRALRRYRPLQDEAIIEVIELLELTCPHALREEHEHVAREPGAAKGAALALGLQQLMARLGGGGGGAVEEVFVPTGLWRMLSALTALCPEHQLTLADFSWLPRQPGGALNAPVVQTQASGRTQDLHGDYLLSPGAADILFPTNFAHTRRMVEAASARARSEGAGESAAGAPSAAATVLSNAEFMRRWHDSSATTSRNGFDPVVDDFSNTSLLATGLSE